MFSITSCKDDEITPREYPRVKTMEVNNITKSGAIFNAEIIHQGNQEIIEYGFIWDTKENPTIDYSDKRILAEEITTGSFTAQIKTTLHEDTSYFVRAYAKNGDYLVYGKNVVFLSLGSQAAKIDDFYPKIGTWGDTISIKGKNFSYKSTKNLILFKNLVSKVIASTDSTIKCIVPESISVKPVSIFLKVANQSTEAKDKFELTVPEIESFSPLKGTFNDTIKIYGKNFSQIKDKNIVSFNGHQAEVVASTKTILSVIVPTAIDIQWNKIEIVLNLQSDTAKGLFEILAPKIDDFSPEYGNSNTLIKIVGDNFSPIRQDNTITFDSNLGEVIEASTKELIVKIPFGIYTNRFFKIGITVVGQTTYTASMFNIRSPWLKRKDVPSYGFDRFKATAFSLLNMGYVGLGSQSNPTVLYKDFYKYNPIDNSWIKVSDFPGEGILHATSFVIDNYAFVGTGSNLSQETNEFWKYNPTSDVWTQIESFPMSISRIKGLSANGRGYIFIDTQGDNFWSYDPSVDKWFKMPSLDISNVGGGDSSTTKGFVIENKIYIGISRNQYYTHIFEFDTNTQQWTTKTGLDYSGSYGDYTGIGFSIGNKGYIMSVKNLFQYDPLLDSWKELSNFPIGYKYHPIGFELGGKAYYGTGQYESGFWEFNPEYE